MTTTCKHVIRFQALGSTLDSKSYNQEFINIVCGEYLCIRIFDLLVWRDEYISVMTRQDSVTPVLRIMVKIMYD